MERDHLSFNPGTQSESRAAAWVILEWPDSQDFDSPPTIYPNCGGKEADERALKAIGRRWASGVIPRQLGTSTRHVIASATRQHHFHSHGSKNGKAHARELEPDGV